MPWSITLFRVAGTEIRIHLTFFLILIWFAIDGYQAAEWQGAISQVLMIVAVFACVVLHEFGHALAARRYGITTPHITLLPIGGLARLSRMPEKPWEQVFIAIAGPLVNLAIAAVLLVLGADLSLDPQRIVTYGQAFISQLAMINLYLFAFNLIPAFPMDGGRILRALLLLRMSRTRATQIAAQVGQAIAILFAVLGVIWGNYLLVLVAGFVFLAARGESGQTTLMEVARQVPLSQAMITVFQSLSPQSTVGEAVEKLDQTGQSVLPVIDGGGLMRGVLTQASVNAAMKAEGPATPALRAMVSAPVVPEDTPMMVVVRLILERGAPMVGVVDDDRRLVGIVSRETLADLMRRGEGAGTRPMAPAPWGTGRT